MTKKIYIDDNNYDILLSMLLCWYFGRARTAVDSWLPKLDILNILSGDLFAEIICRKN